MKKIFQTILFLFFFIFPAHANEIHSEKIKQQIFIYGGDIEYKFVEYINNLINKTDPQICYLPTASADNAKNIKYWEYICKELGIKSNILKVWIDSETQKQSFEDILLSMDAIVVGGGNTLNMLGIWKYQEIDKILKKALDKGIILSGGSAGSICWFKNSISDARPIKLSIVEGLGFLPYSHCPHYNIPSKRALYNNYVEDGKLQSGYACDEHSGILFTNKKVTDVVSTNNQSYSYFVKKDQSRSDIIKLNTRVLIKKGALDTATYRKELIHKKITDYTDIPISMDTPLLSFINIQKLFAEGKYSEYYNYAASSIRDNVKNMQDQEVCAADRDSKLSTNIISSFIYGDLAAMLTKSAADYYSLWYFIYEDGKWKCTGEDIGGDSVKDAEITFREKAPVIIKSILKN
ncbi:peptidase E [Barnesiella propionica]|uniref:Type 1 glutamine amidotransferase-like domain-containing protein n=1 Tax=Barnesiella propionica TaxID=2981781 RepID=UPI0011CAE35E|nr:peptidase E [Barnesiella propionica]MCU6769937.1 peptidase E [Barnesiella propionica]